MGRFFRLACIPLDCGVRSVLPEKVHFNKDFLDRFFSAHLSEKVTLNSCSCLKKRHFPLTDIF